MTTLQADLLLSIAAAVAVATAGELGRAPHLAGLRRACRVVAVVALAAASVATAATAGRAAALGGVMVTVDDLELAAAAFALAALAVVAHGVVAELVVLGTREGMPRERSRSAVVRGLALAVRGPAEPPAEELPPIRVPPGGRGPAGVADDDEDERPRCVRCDRRPCACSPRRPADEPGDRARRGPNG